MSNSKCPFPQDFEFILHYKTYQPIGGRVFQDVPMRAYKTNGWYRVYRQRGKPGFQYTGWIPEYGPMRWQDLQRYFSKGEFELFSETDDIEINSIMDII